MTDRLPHNGELLQRYPTSARKPDVPSDGIFREDERADGHAVNDIEQRWVPALVRRQVRCGETGPVRTTVVVDGEVDEARLSALLRPFRPEMLLLAPPAAANGDLPVKK